MDFLSVDSYIPKAISQGSFFGRPLLDFLPSRLAGKIIRDFLLIDALPTRADQVPSTWVCDHTFPELLRLPVIQGLWVRPSQVCN
jgi:hypothetical protein